MHFDFKKILPHLVVLVLFVVASLLYFNPVLQGKKLFQSDIAQYVGMSKQQKEYKKETGNEAYWTNAAFGGMPTYQLGAKYPHNYIKKLDLTIRFLPRPADYLFLYFIGLYILLLVLKIDYKLAFLGAIAFGFSTYLIIILGVGHNAKAHAIAYMPLVLSGILLTFRGKYIWGFVLTTIAVALELVANHFQMTYYLLLLIICIGVAYFIDAYKKKMLPHFFKASIIMIVAAIVALGLNATNIMATKEYADTSTRGKSELTINPDGSKKEEVNGLDYEYITEYSYGIGESLNLLIPGLMGGGSSDPLPEDSEAFESLVKIGASPQEAAQLVGQTPAYWGDQPIVAAPAYIGAVVIFLAVLALFLVKGRLKWWIVAGFTISLLLSWGKNFSFLTEFFIDYIPLYSKFRAVSSIQVIIELVLPILAVVGLHQYFNDFVKKEVKQKALLLTTGIVGGVTILLLLFKSLLFDFASPYDSLFIEQIGLEYIEAVREDRISIFTSDAIRSLIFILLSATVLFGLLKGKLKEITAISILVVLVAIDLVGVDRRYVNEDDFVRARVMEQPFPKSGADMQILEDDGYYRVYDVTNDAFTSGQASYYHNALGGYHAAKPGRMNDINEFYLRNGNIGILNMLNVRYIIIQNENGGPIGQRNPYANGPAWFVENIKVANTADEELQLLDSLNSKKTAVVYKDFVDVIPLDKVARDTTATITLRSQELQELVYETSSSSAQLGVFSEVYYPKGWNAYIDGKPVEHIRANYVLRALPIPAGDHTIVFKFEPSVIQTGSTISLVSAILLLLLIIGGVFFSYRNTQKTTS
ncbi:YfhO family protein [Patiriisocius hiemis]|uniref:YfhO family protein n=1 Tax=Patiriisocius hiemis TaxID=3075604 RepID=A0ABU2YA66_9FLAO|nr:YfhO family protein [Constantimarinum sp. W242]MDT0555076.1 YfhO family protein [Constantimarinum sp. W242]